MNYDPNLGFESYEHRKGIIKKELRPLILGIILLSIIISILLCHGIINRPQPTELDTFRDRIDSEYYNPDDLIYVEVYAFQIEEGEHYFAIANREDEIGIYGIIIREAGRIYLHNHFKDKIKISQTYVCEAKIYKYISERHEPGEYLIWYDVKEVYLKSDFDSELNKFVPVIISAILVLIVGSFYFTTGFLKKEQSITRVKALGYLVLLNSFILAAWAFYRLLFNKSLEAFDGYSLVIEVAVAYLLFLGPILFFVIFIENKEINLRNYRHNLLISVILGLLFCSISLILLYILDRSFIGIIFRNEVSDFKFNFNNFTTLQLIINFLFFFCVVALVEETVFRWFFAKKFESLFDFEKAVLLSALLFGIAHIPIGVFGYHLNTVELGGFIFSIILYGIMWGYFYLKTNNLVGVIIWHGLWDFMTFNFYFSYQQTNYITWQNHLIINILKDVAIFFIIMIFMIESFKRLRKFGFYSPHPPKMEVVEVQEFVEVKEIPPLRYSDHSS